jgi:tellurite resistance protein TerC
VLRFVRRLMPVSTEYHGQRFFTRENGRRMATPLLMALVMVEVTDLVFAVDSIPAIFAVTKDPFLVYTSNVMAILGLRSMYFLLAGVVHRFVYLKVGLAMVLVFVGAKMLLADLVHVPVLVSLAVIAGLIGGSIAFSLLRPPRTDDADDGDSGDGDAGASGGGSARADGVAAPAPRAAMARGAMIRGAKLRRRPSRSTGADAGKAAKEASPNPLFRRPVLRLKGY